MQKVTRQGRLPGLILIQDEISTLRRDLYRQNIRLADDRMALKILRLEKEKILNQGKEMFVWAVKPRCSKKPVKPRLLLNVAIAGILALFVGVFLAFFIEFVRENREKSVSA